MTHLKYSDIAKNRELGIKYVGKKAYSTKDSPIIFWIDYFYQNEYILVPANYLFDFNSSPCFTHCIVDRDEYLIGLIHDYLYRGGHINIIDLDKLSGTFEKLIEGSKGLCVTLDEGSDDYMYYPTRKVDDKIWLLGATEESVNIYGKENGLRITLGYLGLRLGGGFAYKN